MNSKLIGLKIKQLRSEYSLKIGKRFFQKDLADALDISRGYVGDIESGRTNPNEDLLKKIAGFFDVSLSIFSDENPVGFYINGEKLKYLREKKKLTQSELSLSLGFKDSFSIGKIERLEKGVTEELLNKISLLFNVSSDFLRNKDDFTICPICNLKYSPLDDEDYSEHELFHNKANMASCIDAPKKIPSRFTNAIMAREYVDMHDIFGSDGFDTDKLNDEEIVDFANELMEQMSIVKHRSKYKK